MNVYKQTPTPNETPALIRDSLAKFESVLDAVDSDVKGGYLLAKEKCPTLCNDAFKLIFLRCEVFNVDRAVDRFVKYWNTRVEVFGEEKACLEMSLDGAMKDDVTALQLQYLQVAKETDNDGRAILLFDFNKEADEGVSSESLLRVVWYQVHQALAMESVQKQGVVVFVRCLDNMTDWRPSLSKQISQAGRGILPVRFAGMHFMQVSRRLSFGFSFINLRCIIDRYTKTSTHIICFPFVQPPTFLYIIMRFVKPLVGKKLRHRFYTHVGSVDDLLESLHKFGLGSEDKLPVNFGGSLAFD